MEVALAPSESIAEVMEPAETIESLGAGSTLAKVETFGEDLGQEDDESLWLWFAIAAVILFITENLWSRPRKTTVLEKETINA